MMARKPDYSKLALRGNGHTQDSFSLAVQAAAGLLGRDADYETIYCLSSNAFAPAIDTAEDCTAWWHVNAALGDRCMQTVARRLGLAARRLPIPELAGHWSDADAVARQRRAGVEVLKEALGRGEVILTLGGWQTFQNDRFVPWCWAGVITEVNGDGTIRGACLNGRKDNLLYTVPQETWALSPGDVTLTAQEADLAMLRQAVARIRGDAEPFLPGDWYVYGMKAMDAWIEKMEQTPFCVPCFESAPDRVWTCAINNAQTTTAGAKAAALHLRERLDTFPEAAHSHLEAAATHYDRIAEVLHPALTGEGGEHYRDFIGDLEKQKAHADVLRQAKAELAAAADEMEKALAAARVEREGNRLVLKGFPTGTDYHVRGFGELLALQDCMEYLGVEADWTDLLGYSGDAFGCDGMTDLAHLRSHDVVRAAAESYGFEVTWGFDRGRPSHPQVHEVLSKGTPVVACGARLSPWDEGTYCAEWTVILGDDAKEERILLSHGLDDYAWGLATYHWSGRVPWATGKKVQREGEGLPSYWQPLPGFYLRERRGPASPAKRFLEALRRAAIIHRTERVEFYYAGKRTTKPAGRGFLAGWAGDLRRWAEHIRENPDDPAWPDRSGSPIEDCYFGLVAHSMRRGGAAAFLRRHSSALSRSAQIHVESAAGAYEMSAELSEGLFRWVASTDQVEGLDWHGRLRYGPDSLDDGMGEPEDSQLVFLKPPVGRTAGQRASARKIAERISQQLVRDDVVEAACRTVQSICEHDDTAIAEIERALSAECGREFTEEQLERLKQWGNMWGDLDGCIRAAGRGPIHFELLRMELALGPMSEDARIIRNRMGLEPADLSYPTVIEALLRSIAVGKVVEPWPPARTPERLQRLERLAAALRAWSDGASEQEATKRQGTDAATVQEVYGYLGTPDEDKKAIVALLIEKVETGYSERAVQLERKGLEDPETLEEALAHNVSMCDTQCWTFEHNLKQLLQRIRSKTMSGGWSEPDGPIGWSGPRAMDPRYRPRLDIIVAGLEAWLAGEAGEGDSRQIVEMLGARNAYNEKEWLVRCLHNYLSHHGRGVGY